MKIGFDARYLSHGLTGGVHTYTAQLALEMPALAPTDEFFYYVDTKAPNEVRDAPPNVTMRMLGWRSAWSSVVNDLALARWMERDAVDVAHFPGNYGPRGPYALVVTVHDALNLFRMAEHWRGFGKKPRQVALMAYLGWKTRRAVADADLILTTSEHARGEISRRSGCSPERITPVHEAAGEAFRPLADGAELHNARQRLLRRPLAILADGIKNPAAVIQAYRDLPGDTRRQTELLFFSRELHPRPVVAAALQEPGVRFLPRPTTADLVLLMNLAATFAFPSWYEGFGLPLVEAMACGAPVVAAARGAIPEVLGGAGLLFDLEDPATFRRHLTAVLEDEGLRRELREKSLKRARDFSWKATAVKTLAAYREAVRRRAQDAWR